MDIKELKMKSVDELRRLAKELRSELRDMRFKVATRQLNKVRNVRKGKKDLARIETLLRAISVSSSV
ncbi:MAG: 50S ribosomal protein L29 [Candidatus Uhrbacteria bacterium]|nr:50S ribosomal protein L29 [Candidatus Uhrbacteria bacterium]MDP3794073.1 50S ribosomal protein L29 [Candidatus Uhrbacteria bacterium]